MITDKPHQEIWGLLPHATRKVAPCQMGGGSVCMCATHCTHFNLTDRLDDRPLCLEKHNIKATFEELQGRPFGCTHAIC